MEHRFQKRVTRPELPDSLPVPSLEIGAMQPWYELEEPYDVAMYVTFTGSGRAPDRLYVGWLYILPLGDLEVRRPTLDEIYAAAGYCELEGVMWELPPFRGGHVELPEGADGLMVHFRQMGAEQGSPAEARFNLSAGVVQGVH